MKANESNQHISILSISFSKKLLKYSFITGLIMATVSALLVFVTL